MDECLDSDLPVLAQGLHFRQGQLTGRHYARDAELPEHAHRLGGRHRHLRAGVQGQIGTSLVEGLQQADILDDHPVEPRLREPLHECQRLLHLLLAGEDVGGEVDLFAPQVGVFE